MLPERVHTQTLPKVALLQMSTLHQTKALQLTRGLQLSRAVLHTTVTHTLRLLTLRGKASVDICGDTDDAYSQHTQGREVETLGTQCPRAAPRGLFSVVGHTALSSQSCPAN
jgi:hypothetical protein